MHEQVLVPGPVYVQSELAPHPPLLVRQLLMGLQLRPSGEETPCLHAHVIVPGPV